MRDRIFKKRDGFILAAVVVLAIVAILLLFPRTKGNIAVVTYKGELVQEIDLSKTGLYHIEGDLPVTLEVKDGKIRFIQSQCPDKLCEGFGWIGDELEYAICMPARVSVQIKSRS